MRVPLSWLSDHVELTGPVSALADALTFAGLEIEAVDHVGEEIAGVVTARVVEVGPHPDADRLSVVVVDVDGDARTVVCGAHNFGPGDVVPLASPGAKLPGGVEVGRRQVRGVWSDGMLTSARELAVFEDHSGILVLPPDTPVGADLVEAVGLRDAVLELKTFPNRGDTLSIRGVAREAALALGAELKPVGVDLTEAGEQPAAELASVAVEDIEGCKLYVGRVLTGVDAACPSPLWMARRLYLYGMRPLGAVVDVTNYLLIDQGQPLHVFDLDRIPGSRIVVRRARAGEGIRTLDGIQRRLGPGDTMISSGEEPLALAGIMGGADSEVRPETSRILLESAHFPPATVRASMRRLGMSTESGQRWGRGVDPELPRTVADRAAAMIVALAGGAVAPGRLEAGPGAPQREAIRLPWARSARRLGAPEAPEFAAGYLQSVGCAVEIAGDDVLAVPPSWRFDLERWADLEEEVARRWGYDRLPATLPLTGGGRLEPEQRARRLARVVLAGMGLTEVQTTPFLDGSVFDEFGLEQGDPRRRTVRIANPLSEEAAELRTTLLPGLAEVARRNLAKGLPGAAVHEIGNVFLAATAESDPDAEGRPDEPRLLGLLLAGAAPAGRFDDAQRRFDVWDVKGMVEGLARGLGVDGVGFAGEGHMPFHPGRSARIELDERAIGMLGQLHPRVVTALGLPPESFAAELDLGALLDAVPGTRPAPLPWLFPELSFDVAFAVPAGVAAGALEAVLRDAGGELLVRLDLFDVYQGGSLPRGFARSLAYHVVLRAPDRTLTDEDGRRVRDRLERAAADRGAELRTA